MIVQGHVRAALPDYDVGPELGQGGFGRVYAGRHRRLGRPVAIKVLGLSASDVSAGAEVDAEAQIIARLDHPHIVRVFDYVRASDMALIVMELLSGGTLAERAHAGLSPQAACATVAAVAAALHRVHRLGLLHRDIKPSNIMFAADNAPRLTDFGIARLLEATGGIAPTSVIGSTPYLAPEVFELAAPGVGADVYALGAVFYELLAGAPPFDVDPRPHVMAERHRFAVPPPLPAPAAAFEALTMRALAKDPADRQPGALAFVEELVAVADRVFGPGWLAGAGVSFRGDDDLRRPDEDPADPRGLFGLPGPRGTLPLGRPVGAADVDGPPPHTPDRWPPDRRPRVPGAGRRTGRIPPPGTLSLARWMRADPPAARFGSARVSAAALVAVIVAVVALLATGVLRVGPGSGAVAAAARASTPPPTVYPVAAPMPLRGLISLAADASAGSTAGPAGGIYLTDSSQHSLLQFTGATASTLIGHLGGDRVGRPGAARDEPAATSGLRRPGGVAVQAGSVFVADEWNCAVRRIYRPPGQPWRVETVAGRPADDSADAGIGGATSDPGSDAGHAPPSPADICPRGATTGPTSVGARIGTPTSVAVGPTGALYVTTGYAGQVWRIDPNAGTGDYRSTPATLVAGNGVEADRRIPATRERRYTAAAPATRIPLENTYAVAVDGAGRVFVLSYGEGYARIHLIDNGTITTVVQRPLADADLTALAPAPGGRGVLFTDARSRTVWQIAAGPGAAAGEPTRMLGGTCVGDTEQLFGVAADRAGDLYYSCNDATQASVYRVTARALAAGTTGPGQRVLY
ncbi:protein kinase [Frankia sp. AgB32]|uniref:protein kinase domain-containing protein n=1 Tax=Frankia sp. AgB32 TaxID=631119 RepID=UPI002010865A|nr:protein kinase [Frankia sp. AgB32]MCK9894232.1 protein kinase [Frankia sp. AgB32]